VSVMLVPGGNGAEHVAPQSMPVGDDVTVPDPVLLLVMLRVGFGAGSVNAASMLVLALMVNVQVPVPLHPPPVQPVNVEPLAAAAVSVMLVPVVNDLEHVVPQSIPAGDDVTFPPPLPLLEMLSCA